MPRRLVTVPLERTWLLRHRWPVPAFHDLPIELEYLSAQDLDDRFAQLDAIVKKYYPTVWPNLFTLFGLSIVFGLCVVFLGIVPTVQGSCFVIPITLVLWARIRKEVRDRAVKKFKRRSQKILRAWTTEDSNNYAVQWKLRLRTVTRIEREAMDEASIPIDATDATLGLADGDQPLQFHDQEGQRQGQLDQEQQISSEGQRHEVISMEDENANHSEGRERTRARRFLPFLHRWSPPCSPPASRQQHQRRAYVAHLPRTLPSLSTSPDTHNLHQGPQPQHHDNNSDQQRRQRRRRLSSIQLFNPSRIVIQPIAITTTATTSNDNTITTRRRGGLLSRPGWQEGMEALEDMCCCFTCARSTRRVWMIEISLRECLLDEYALTIPSPVYRDYRLPQYDEIMQPAGTPPSLPLQPIYSGLPPAYESESEEEEEYGDDDDDDDEDDEPTARDGENPYQQQHSLSPSSQQQQGLGYAGQRQDHEVIQMREMVVAIPNMAPSTTMAGRVTGTIEAASTATTSATVVCMAEVISESMMAVSVMNQSQSEAVKVGQMAPSHVHPGIKNDVGETTTSTPITREKTAFANPSSNQERSLADLQGKENENQEGKNGDGEDDDQGESSQSSLSSSQ